MDVSGSEMFRSQRVQAAVAFAARAHAGQVSTSNLAAAVCLLDARTATRMHARTRVKTLHFLQGAPACAASHQSTSPRLRRCCSWSCAAVLLCVFGWILQVRKTGEAYVAHCIETALIVEANLPHWRQHAR